MVRIPCNPVLSLNVRTDGCLNPPLLTAVNLDFTGTTKLSDIASVTVIRGEEEPLIHHGEEMCIRDRFGRFRHGPGRFQRAWRSVRGQRDAVSYTHLDVYKRQELIGRSINVTQLELVRDDGRVKLEGSYLGTDLVCTL